MTCTHEELREVRREFDAVRWCFGCRKHLPHDFVVLAPVGRSYYGPTPMLQCSGCGQDRTVFPGMATEWVER